MKPTVYHSVTLQDIENLECIFGTQKPTDRELTEEEFRNNYEIPEWLMLLRQTAADQGFRSIRGAIAFL